MIDAIVIDDLIKKSIHRFWIHTFYNKEMFMDITLFKRLTDDVVVAIFVSFKLLLSNILIYFVRTRHFRLNIVSKHDARQIFLYSDY